mgnify:FL=1
MKVNWLITDDDEQGYSFMDLYIDLEHVVSFNVPLDANEFEENVLNITMVNGITYKIEITNKITAFLDKKFKIK